MIKSFRDESKRRVIQINEVSTSLLSAVSVLSGRRAPAVSGREQKNLFFGC